MPLRGLTIIVCSPEPDRLYAAARLAATSAALGWRTRLFLDEAAVSLAGLIDAGDAAALLRTCLDLGATLGVCQSGLAAAGLAMSDLDPRVVAGGLTGMLATLGDDRLVTL